MFNWFKKKEKPVWPFTDRLTAITAAARLAERSQFNEKLASVTQDCLDMATAAAHDGLNHTSFGSQELAAFLNLGMDREQNTKMLVESLRARGLDCHYSDLHNNVYAFW